jgi:hydrogenase 3 maturation protease
VAVLALGSRLRGDDIAGLLAAETLKAALKPPRGSTRRLAPRGRRVKIFLGETAPENLTGEIKRFKPTHLVVIDAAESGLKPGELSLIEVAATGSGGALSTHNLPISVLTDYLQKSTGCACLVLGIQPASIHFGAEPTAAVLRAAARLAAHLAEAMA